MSNWNPRADDWRRALSAAQQARASAESKQSAISDLDSIRSGAAAGATALQTVSVKVNGTTHEQVGGLVDLGTIGGGGGGITEETDPTVPSWAKQASKPTYTAAEVGALPASTVIPTVPTALSAFTDDLGSSPTHSHSQYLTSHQSLAGYATESWVEGKGYLTEHQSLSSLLPLAGGTMSGAITRNGNLAKTSATNKYIELYGSTAYNTGAFLRLDGGTSSRVGEFRIGAYVDGSGKNLIGKPDGTLTWDGTNISLEGHTHRRFKATAIVAQTTITEATHSIDIPIPAGYKDLIVRLYAVAGTASTLQVTVTFSDGQTQLAKISNGINTAARLNRIIIDTSKGWCDIQMSTGTTNNAATVYRSGTSEVFVDDSVTITQVTLTASSSTSSVIPASSKYVVYGAA